jgi:predicted ATPase
MSFQLCFEAEVRRMAGEIERMSPEPDAAKAEAYFDRALAVARAQQAKSWELRAATSLARLWQGQGKRDEARDLVAPVYGWFTEGFDTRDLKEARTLLDELIDMTGAHVARESPICEAANDGSRRLAPRMGGLLRSWAAPSRLQQPRRPQ